MDMVEKVADAIERAQATRAYGLYDYSNYPGSLAPHVVRDELVADRSRSEVLRTSDRDEASERYESLCRAFVARAAIEAMREPTEAMKQAPYDAEIDFGPGGTGDIQAGPENVWQAMINAALTSQS